jgi:hemoglobin
MKALAEHRMGERILLDDEQYTLTDVARTRWGSKTFRITSADGVTRWLTPRKKEGLAPYVDGASIERFVHAFYAQVQQDDVLGPIFDTHIAEWDPHLARMVHFWSAILLGESGFMGNPMQKHRNLVGVAPEDFNRWLALFGSTLAGIFEPPVAEAILSRAQRIAGRLSAGMFESPERACG